MSSRESRDRPDRGTTSIITSWLTLGLVRGMSPRLYHGLLRRFGSPEQILATGSTLIQDAGLEKPLANAIARAGTRKAPGHLKAAVATSVRWLEGADHHLLTCRSPDYPPLLAELPDAPPLLFVKGNPDILRLPHIAMVGSRRPTAGGRRNARRFAHALATSGFGVCSGLALGIDAESHSAALDARGSTAAVLGTGIDVVYPPGNRELFGRIARSGVMLSEFYPGVAPLRTNFPRRNRIISGLSLGVLVVEAGEKSGSMITARLALEQGREVFAIPGSIQNPVARGCHRLINDGAKLVQDVGDIVEELGGLLAGVSSTGREQAEAVARNSISSLAGETRRVFDAIGDDPVTPDALAVETHLAIEQVNVALVDLELKGLVRRENSGVVLERA